MVTSGLLTVTEVTASGVCDTILVSLTGAMSWASALTVLVSSGLIVTVVTSTPWFCGWREEEERSFGQKAARLRQGSRTRYAQRRLQRQRG